MPNWCSNSIIIKGTEEQITLLTRILNDVPKLEPQNRVVFESLIGRDPEMGKEEYEQGGWFNANSSWYGTKWDVSYDDCNFTFEKEYIYMYPDTAWSPPINFGVLLHKMYGVEVEMFYSEGGNDYCGKAYINEHGLLEEDYDYLEGNYRFDEEYFWESLFQNEVEYAIDNEMSVDDFVAKFPYVDKEDKKEIRKIYKQELKEKTK